MQYIVVTAKLTRRLTWESKSLDSRWIKIHNYEDSSMENKPEEAIASVIAAVQSPAKLGKSAAMWFTHTHAIV